MHIINSIVDVTYAFGAADFTYDPLTNIYTKKCEAEITVEELGLQNLKSNFEHYNIFGEAENGRTYRGFRV